MSAIPFPKSTLDMGFNCGFRLRRSVCVKPLGQRLHRDWEATARTERPLAYMVSRSVYRTIADTPSTGSVLSDESAAIKNVPVGTARIIVSLTISLLCLYSCYFPTKIAGLMGMYCR